MNTSQDLAYRSVVALAERYNFDSEDAIRSLGLAMIRVERKAPIKAKGQKVAKVVGPKSEFPLPYNGEFNDTCCYALRQNNGLYTQCTGLRKVDAQFCKGCANTMQKIGGEVPEYGTIQQRMAVGIFDYVDPKGRKPVAYVKVMKKYKVIKEQVVEEAGKLNIVINPDHFVVPEETKRGRPKTEKEEKSKGAKGRPKKVKKVLLMEDDEEDLFASLVANADESNEDESNEDESNEDESNEDESNEDESNEDESNEEMDIVPKSKKGKTDEEKEAERLAKEAEKEAKRIAAEKQKAEKLEKQKAEKLEKEAKKKEERLAREEKKKAEEAEKEAKKEEERLAREEKKKAEEAEKLAKKMAAEKAKADKEAKLAAEKLAKEAAKANKANKINKLERILITVAAAPEQEEPDVVKKIEFEGKKYLKSKKSGIVYDYNKYVKEGEQEVVGKWNDVSNKIDFSSTEEEEEEYDM
jgi:hypothetical protein